MSKLQDMFTQARRAQSGGGMGFLGKSKTELKPRVAALVVELPGIDAGSAEAAVKAGANGLLFPWDGKNTSSLEKLKTIIDSARASRENIVSGLRLTGGWEKLEREQLERLKDQGINYIILPLRAQARLLGMQIKDLDLVVSVPMNQGELYPNFVSNLSAFGTVAAIHLDFGLSDDVSKLTIEDVMHYRAVREAVHSPALLDVSADLSHADVYTLLTLGIQGMVLPASDDEATTHEHITAVGELLEKIYQEEKEREKEKSPGIKP
jgi:hypothetical protein